ncbi:polysaccharide pyruvyl transferase family protein [Candidatus Pelagibacter ubique]|nr:polysaccharide pyruvyl transferase family protein [Candidatus Pelagibacter ubique]
MNKYFVILTGAKNNAGDFLIKYRAKELFQSIRPDRQIIDFNAFEQIDKNKLNIINSSKALILMGGPSLQKNMYPGIYKLISDLGKIKTAITTMGIGWKSISGNWNNTHNYELNKTTIKLLNRIKEDGLTSSVRDYHTLNVLLNRGYDNFLMTGCPAYYNIENINKNFEYPTEIKKISFSLGVSFLHSRTMERQMKNLILLLRKEFVNQNFEVVFHHTLNKEKFLKSGSGKIKHNKKYNDFSNWLRINNISYVDISGDAEKLINYYSQIDLHIGYRLHAHIFMNSIKRLSILISEDGRAKACRSVTGSIVIDGYNYYHDSLFDNLKNKIWFGNDNYDANMFVEKDIINNLNYLKKTRGKHSIQSHKAISNNFLIMKEFLKKLP